MNAKRVLTWKQFDGKRWQFERWAIREFRKALLITVRPVTSADSVEQAIGRVDYLDSNAITKAFKDVYGKVGSYFAVQSQSELKRLGGVFEIKSDSTVFDRLIRDWIAVYGADRIKDITTTTINRLKIELQRAFDNGDGIEVVARNIVKSGSGIADLKRARVIARTEIISASNKGSLDGAKDTGIPLKKEWLATLDNRTRSYAKGDAFDHTSSSGVDGQKVLLDGLFNVNGESMQFPGDFTNGASAGNVINCFTGDNIVAFDSIKKSIRSKYSGQIITVETSKGYQLTGTPNHPILTSNGFIRLGEIDKTTNLVCCNIDKSISSDFNVDNIPITFEKIHNSFSINRHRLGISTIDVNLYGRIPNGNIDIVNINSFLWNRIKTSRFKFIYKQFFKSTNFTKAFFFCYSLFNTKFDMIRFWHTSDFIICRLNLLFTFFNSHFRPFKFFRLGLVSNVNTRCYKSISDSGSSNTKIFTYSVFTNPGLVKINNFISRKFNFVNAFSPSMWNKFFFVKSSVDTRNSQTGNITDLGYRFSRFVHIDKVVSINNHNVKNVDVFTIETDIGIYNVNGILASNCRCSQIYEPLT